jgi:hypothetical protein
MMAMMAGIRVRDKDLVICLDSSTTATKVIAWRRDGTIAISNRCEPFVPLDARGDSVRPAIAAKCLSSWQPSQLGNREDLDDHHVVSSRAK